MIVLDVEFNHFRLQLLSKRPDTTTYLLANPTSQNPEPVLGHPDYMVLAVPNRV